MNHVRLGAAVGLACVTVLGACASKPEARETKFLSTYANLKPVNEQRMNYVAPQLRDYKSFIIDPVKFFVPPKKLTQAERADVAEYFRKKFVELLEKRGLTITSSPGPGVARVRLALTDIAESTWWMKVHPASRAAGAGTGGAAMEGEVVDSVSGKQIGAVVQASTGNQFNYTSFSTVADVKSAIDKWADQAAQRLDELRAGTG